jgi:DNA-binding NarL/FixJ family response regulator
MRNVTIYILDRNPLHGNFLKYQLMTKRFANVKVFPNPDECMYAIRKFQKPDFVICDVVHPSISASELLAAIKRESPETHVLFFSSVNDERLAKDLLQQGATDYISKSANPEAGSRELLMNLEYLFKAEYQL